MSEFIKVTIDDSKCLGTADCGGCIKVCPVNVFQHPPQGTSSAPDKEVPAVVEENQDECTLCDLCLQECNPRAILIKKLYEP